MSLQGTIINLAQNYVGSNNINLLEPNGQFGSRLSGGKDAGAARYIFTELNKLTPTIFVPDDQALLAYLDDDGFSIEPQYYVPILPMVLVNGANGIGTGFSTQVPCYNPEDIVSNLLRMLDDQEPTAMHPWYRGFMGSVVPAERGYTTKGVWTAVPGGLEITELPIGMWTDNYSDFLEGIVIDNAEKDAKKVKKQILQSFEKRSTESTIRFVLKIATQRLQQLLADPSQLEAELKLTSTLSTTNMHLYNQYGVVQKYASVDEILRAFFDVRLDYYIRRRIFMLKRLRREQEILHNKIRFISEVRSKALLIFDRAKGAVLQTCRRVGT